MPRDRYVQCVVPQAAIDFQDHDYTPWYVGHMDCKRLTQEAIREQYQEFKRLNPKGDHEIATFMGWLERQDGYTVFYSGPEAMVSVEDDEE